ncbi:receptor-like protein kinase HERK 1 [Salvia miltiorrhiza]|uniref:receptor-like protein kinase HERK 1 n=1 Tax=Salvia miltiorrhiza TaxID=226208 RepID=UPI0025AB9755|nr:receptor-like protein kinase HERK 1 [Salvia miltiorrhiza]
MHHHVCACQTLSRIMYQGIVYVTFKGKSHCNLHQAIFLLLSATNFETFVLFPFICFLLKHSFGFLSLEANYLSKVQTSLSLSLTFCYLKGAIFMLYMMMMDCGVLRFSFLQFLILNLACCCIGFHPIDKYYINCGSSTDVAIGSITYIADKSSSRFLSTPRDILAHTNSNSITSSDDSVLFPTARIFTDPSRYTFPISQTGRHWIRLRFYPFLYQNLDMKSASFSVYLWDKKTRLLTDFSPQKATVKEYSLNVTSGNIVITFSPSRNSFAYVNSVEVVSAPDSLIIDDASLFNPIRAYSGLLDQALETVVRVNMGGPMVSLVNDTLGRSWVPDRAFLLHPDLATTASNIGGVRYPGGGATQDTAPPTVYGTCTKMNSESDPNSNFNVTWNFGVDVGFQYLIRLHFCDIVSKGANQLVFDVYIDAFLVDHDLELSSVSGGRLATAYFRDFVTPLMDKNNLSVSIGPSKLSYYPDALLNGLEVMKISKKGSFSTGASSLAAYSRSKKKLAAIVGVSVGVPFVAVIVIGVLVFMQRRKKKQEVSHSKTWTPVSVDGGASHTMDSNLSYCIPFAVVEEATNGFDESRVIGVGGFGKVYKGVLSNGTKLAVKRGNPRSQQGLAEFRTEIEMLSRFRHRHLVSLLGYCDEKNEMILVYEYMENGSLKSHLYGSNFPSLGWKERLQICIGAARGLHYLHTGSTKAVIHRDVKSANILLDENLMAKVADFGLSKAGPDMDQTHVSTAVKGSFGYLDPEYFRRQQLTEKSDVYSFGVVMLEVVCARPVIDPTLAREMVNLAEWAIKWQRKGELDQIIDHSLVGRIKPDSLRKYGETAEKCLADFGVDRPSMGDVLWNLEYALQLQVAVMKDDPEESSSNFIHNISPQITNFNSNSFENDLSDASISKVFSQLIKSEGR